MIDISNIQPPSKKEENATLQYNGVSFTWVEDYPFQGGISGYASGGVIPSSPGASNVIDKFPFASDANAADHGDLYLTRQYLAGQSSSTHGYTSGGYRPLTSPATRNDIDKFPFASTGNAVDAGDLTVARYGLAGHSSSDYGYASGGSGTSDVIDKFPFASSGNAADVGDLTQPRYLLTGQSSTISGYSSGGSYSSVNQTTIYKFPFSVDSNSTDVGDLTQARRSAAGQSSLVSGYTSGGYTPGSPTFLNTIDKFPFSSDGNATDVGDLFILSRWGNAGQSSLNNGYNSGGTPGPTNRIEKFPFSVDANSADVGDLTVARYTLTGQQY